MAQKALLKRLSSATSSTVLVLTSISIRLECLVGFYGGWYAKCNYIWSIMEHTKSKFKNMNLIAGIQATFSYYQEINITPISPLAIFQRLTGKTYALDVRRYAVQIF